MRFPVILFLGFLVFGKISAQTVDEKVDSLLAMMSLEQKVGQMTQVERGSLDNIQDIATFGIGSILSGGGSSPSPNTINSWANMYNNFQSVALQSELGIPLIYGIDAVHGHNNVYGAVIFPHNIGLGCTWNPALVKTANQIVAKEVAATGIDWTFAPCIAVPRNERWGRTYEGFGETPEIQKIMAEASVLGLQGNDLSDNESILACAKHFVGDGGTLDGKDQGNTVLSEAELRSIHMEGYIDAINSGVGSIMASYNSWNGQKLHGHDYLLTDVLKEELGFEGFIISDWKGVDQINENFREAIRRGINAGIDMVMVPDRYEVFISHLISLVESNEVSMDRINDAVRRILKQKFLLNLFDEPFTDSTLASSVGSQNHRDVARQTVRESLVLLNAKNDILPLQKNDQTLLVAGTLARDLGAQCGGWTISWQGSNGNITLGTDILKGIQNVTNTSQVIYSAIGNYSVPIDVAVVVIGEKTPYSEGSGDRTSLELDQTDIDLLKKLKEDGLTTIAVIVSGRPLIINDILAYSDAVIAAWYPGTEGEGIAEILFGDYDPSGRLTHTWPKSMSQIPINFGDASYDPLFSYKHGLQEFPSASTSDQLLPFAAGTNPDGNKILLSLSDKISVLNASKDDFGIVLNGTPQSGLINDIFISDFDESILILELNSGIQPDESIGLSYVGGGIYSSDLILAALDDYYVINAVSNGAIRHKIPGKIEAENYFDMKGIQTETCTDVGGGINVGYIEAGDWMKYNVEVSESGIYEVVCRISGNAGGKLRIIFNDQTETEVSYNSTNGWQNWKDFKAEIQLEQGEYVMQALAQSDAFNINYYEFKLISPSNISRLNAIKQIDIFPNPMGEVLSIECYNSKSQNATIKLFDYAGREAQLFYKGRLQAGLNNFSFNIVPDLPEGVYFVEIKDESKRYFRKLIKN